MCGRYRLTAKDPYLRDHLGLDEDPAWTPRWNSAPTQLVPIVRHKSVSSTRSFDLVRWGLIPSWAKDPSIATKTINAMSKQRPESLRSATRCACDAVSSGPAASTSDSGTVSKQKQPFSIGMAYESTFSFAGLWESWTDPGGDIVETCTILTATPNALVADFITGCR